ncbi:hypothetical protein J6590_039300 [Homalodisca vitripennis]|nr:hypothetical protein J6590_039300 [Homalodisca vitripennis]
MENKSSSEGETRGSLARHAETCKLLIWPNPTECLASINSSSEGETRGSLARHAETCRLLIWPNPTAAAACLTLATPSSPPHHRLTVPALM